jgi:uncharacterized protein (TIGR00255 family)
MIRSMTGYGRREAAWKGGSVSAEIRAVNHRFCEVQVRLPRHLTALEEGIKKLVQSGCARGHIDVIVTVSGHVEGKRTASLDRALATQYYSLLRQLQRELRVTGTVDLALLVGLRDVIVVTEEAKPDRAVPSLVKRTVKGALADLDAMRRREGNALAKDLKERLAIIAGERAKVAVRAPHVVEDAMERMRQRVAKLLAGGVPDQARLSQELAHFADRCDVSEELARLDSHLTQFDTLLGSREPVGRTMDFLLQEMGREINTIGSKANDAAITGHVITVKGELEKIREQIQNIE